MKKQMFPLVEERTKQPEIFVELEVASKGSELDLRSLSHHTLGSMVGLVQRGRVGRKSQSLKEMGS